MSDASEAIGALPFVRNKPAGGREFWHVTPTGEHDVDFSLGRGYAILAVEMSLVAQVPALVCWVLREMGRNPAWSSVESGFMRGLTDLACVTMSMARGNPRCVRAREPTTAAPGSPAGGKCGTLPGSFSGQPSLQSNSVGEGHALN